MCVHIVCRQSIALESHYSSRLYNLFSFLTDSSAQSEVDEESEVDEGNLTYPQTGKYSVIFLDFVLFMKSHD